MQLTGETRCNIFKEPLAEIVPMLEQNLLDKFKRMREQKIRETGAFVGLIHPCHGLRVRLHDIIECYRLPNF